MKTTFTLLAFVFCLPISAAEPHWAFQKPIRPPVPKSTASPIDAFLQTELAKHSLKFSEPADKATLLRRVTLDLIGLPPTREELHAFLNDASPNAYEIVVDRLLADPRHGERWARHWMDVWRYSDWYGRRAVPDVMNSYPQIWRWRDWIVKSLNENRGYDWMVSQMLAADELNPTQDENIVATGFLVRNWFKWNYNQWMRDNVEHVGKAFLGLTFNCCHCHDHKYDPLTHEDYFRFRAIFEPLELRHDRVPGQPDPGPFKKYVYTESYGPIKSGMIRVFDEKLDAPTHMYSGGDERNKIPGKPPVSPGMPKFLGGDSFKVRPIELPAVAWYPGMKQFLRNEEAAKRVAAIKAAEAEFAKMRNQPRFKVWAIEFAPLEVQIAEAQLIHAKADLHQLECRIQADESTGTVSAGRTASRAEQTFQVSAAKLGELKARLALLQGRAAKSPQMAQLEKNLVAATAVVKQAEANLKKDDANYTPLSPKYPKTSTGRRAALAKWIASNENPLTARVAVNHLWNWHFGRPIVESTFDFGKKGQKPSHPELLDWLATELMNNGWKFKPLHRQIVLSQAYRQSSRFENAPEEDRDNRLLWSFRTQRMEAEVLRDSLLAVAGDLDLTIGGPEIPHEQGQASKRRSLYFAHHGESQMGWLEMFDAANPCDCYKRSSSVMPQQALVLSNSDLAVNCGKALAKKLAAKTESEFIVAVFETVLNRAPKETELAVARDYLSNGGNRDGLIMALLNHNDFVTVR